jgi:hypothetical protein
MFGVLVGILRLDLIAGQSLGTSQREIPFIVLTLWRFLERPSAGGERSARLRDSAADLD